MNTLLVDIGNTRIKWAVLRGARLGPMRATAHRGTSAAVRTVVNAAPRDVERVLAVCVAGVRLERALTGAVRARFGVATEFVRSSRSLAGVRNSYRDTWRLGADRWVGAIAAHDIAGARPVLVANIGTALTIDVVAGNGRHLGGAIAPGPDTMIASLLGGTVGIRRRAQGARVRRAVSSGLFAADTARALDAGARYAAAALIDRAVREAQGVLGRRPLVLLTGGAAGGLRTHIESVLRPVPDLVLRGLALLARG
jgi:type III pantothenate kinase